MAAKQYIIDELYTQDQRGAVYHAKDAENGHSVELHRFFPYHSAEIGMASEAVQRYVVTINFMRFWQHRSLRKILDGGCDEIDHIPYLVCQARTERSIADLLETSSLSMSQAKQLAEQALSLLIELDDVFRATAPWLSLRAEDVEVFEDGSKYRFSINPMQLVEPKYETSAVKELVSLVEHCLGWTGRVVAGSTLGSLSGWVRQARSKDYSAKQALALLLGANPSELPDQPAQSEAAKALGLSPAFPGNSATPTGSLVASPTGMMQQASPTTSSFPIQKNSPLPWVIAGVMVLLTGAIAFFVITQMKSKAEIADAKTPKVQGGDEKSAGAANTSSTKNETKPIPSEEQRRAEIASKALKMQQDLAAADQQKKALANKPKTAKRNGDYKPEEVALVAEQIGQNISIAGKLTIAKASKSGKTLYLRFSDDTTFVLGRYVVNKATPSVSLGNLQPFVGKNIRIKGIVSKEAIPGGVRYAIDFTQLKDIEIIPEAKK